MRRHFLYPAIAVDYTGPEFVAAGTVFASGGVSSAAPALPAGIITGDLLISWVELANTKAAVSVSAGWTKGSDIVAGSINLSWAWRIANGATDTACTFSWSGSTATSGCCLAYRGNKTVSPFGDTAQHTGGAASSIDIDTTAAMSLAFYLTGTPTVTAFTQDAAYTSRVNFQQASRNSIAAADKEITGSGVNQTCNPTGPSNIQTQLLEILDGVNAPQMCNNGTIGTVTNGTSITPALPASRVTGNLLFAFMGGTVAKNVSVSASWTAYQIATATDLVSAYRYVDGSETANVFSWSGNMNANGYEVQISGAKSSTPIGAQGTNTGTSTTASHSGITTTEDNSMVLAVFVGTGNVTLSAITAGWTVLFATASSIFSYAVATKEIEAAGATGSVQCTISSSVGWRVSLYEIKRP